MAFINSTGLYTPENSVSNDELVLAFNKYVDEFNARMSQEIGSGSVEALVYSSAEFIEKASGIKSRYLMDSEGVLDTNTMSPRIAERLDSEPSVLAEMGVKAAKAALNAVSRVASDIDLVIVACSNLQRAYPAISIEIQTLLGCGGYAFDMNVACSSATFGIKTANDAIASGSATSVLVISPEICSGHLDFTDRDSHFIFGDAATAVLVEKIPSGENTFEIINTRAVTKFSNNIRNNFGFLNRAAPDKKDAPDKLFKQQGRSVFKEVCPMVSQLINSHLADNRIKNSQLSRLWLHQANLNMNKLIAKNVLGKEFNPSDAPVILDQYANTSSAGSIIAFHQYAHDLTKGNVGIICSFGAGYSIGSVLVKKH